MKIALCYFTWSKDLGLLEQSLRSVARLRKKYADVEISTFAFDDGRSPLSDVPEGIDFYEQTMHDRKGNLNGIENLYVMLSIYTKLAEDFDWVVKVDCDTYINDLEWLVNEDPTKVVNVGIYNNKLYAHGCLYALSSFGAKLIEEMAHREDLVKRFTKTQVCEDYVIGVLANMTCKPQVKTFNRYNELGKSHAGYQDFAWTAEKIPRLENPAPELMYTHMSVTFKQNSHGRTPEERELDRADAVVRMVAYADWVDAHEETLEKANDDILDAEE